ncbi:helix-turn-helix domain-containing protein [Ferruginibacter albus]|uniref:helix-turn-helix domain-containing protein n=1 Tax=Ferruginibacter albus TaxID=2875540 RepID=UPI0036F4498D|nr:helix-turn-helix domain-containing protein [Ferruginibacter albus]
MGTFTRYMDDSLLLLALGKKIRSIRRNKDMTQNQLSINCNFEKSTMSKIEAGKVNLSYITLYRISKGLGVDIKDLLPI